MSAVAQRQRLRTKTGCLTCRSRRKKCDEKTPTCDRCSFAGRKCQWPSTNDLLDRRYSSHPNSRHTPEGTLSIRSELVAHLKVSDDVEGFMSRYFSERFYGLLLLPECHPEFQRGWIQQINDLMVKDKSLYYSALTNAASHIYTCDHVDQMQDLALDYYSKTLRGLANTLARPQLSELVHDDGFLMSTMFLYLHGCMGSGTFSDIPPHLNAAMMLLSHRLLDGDTTITQPFERIAIESVMYQIFLIITGLWSEQLPADNFSRYYSHWWISAEKLIERSPKYDGPHSLNTPVLGVPPSLFRLAMQAKEIYQKTAPYDLGALRVIEKELSGWKMLVLSSTNPGIKLEDLENGEFRTPEDRSEDHHESATHLYTLIVSLLLEQMTACIIKTESTADEMTLGHPWIPFMAPSGSWQIEKAIGILRRYQNDDRWFNSFIGNWPVYTIGFFLEDPEHIKVVRNDLKRRWEATRIMQLNRFIHDLDLIWSTRKLETT